MRETGPGGGPRRSRVLLALGAVVAAGIVLRHLPGKWGDVSGGVLYVAAVSCTLLLVRPATVAWRVCVVALAVSCGVEALQALGVARAVVRVWPPARWVVGSGFSWSDLAAYAAGAGITYVVLRSVGVRSAHGHPR